MADIPATHLRQERFRLLEDIANEFKGEIVFPTCFDVSAHISEVMSNESASLQQIAQQVLRDPLIATKILQVANSVTYNPAGSQITDLSHALNRIGMESARSIALACALAQLAKSNKTSAFADQLKQLLQHSLKTAATARVLARRLATRVNAETAMLAGLVHDLGGFFMLNRVEHYPELVARPDTVRYLVAQWHEGIGTTLLDALGLPEEVIEAVKEVDIPRPNLDAPRTLSDVIYVANLLCGGYDEMQRLDLPNLPELETLIPPAKYSTLQAEIDEACAEVLQIW